MSKLKLFDAKIGGHYYTFLNGWTSKKEAQGKAEAARKTGLYKSVRIVTRHADRRYAVHYVAVR